MASAGKLTWQPGAGNRGGRWKKIYQGQTLYYDGGEGRDDAEAFGLATYRFWIDKREIDRGRVPPSKKPGGWAAYDRMRDEQHDRQEQLRDATKDFTQELPTVVDPDAVPIETIGQAIDHYLAGRRGEVAAGALKPTSFNCVSELLQAFVSFAGDRPLEAVNSRLTDDYRRHLLSRIEEGRYKQSTASLMLSTVRSWVNWAYETERIDALPRNLRRLRIARTSPAPQTFTVEELGQIFEVANDREQLYLLTMINCGMYGSDIGSLRPDEVNFLTGRITRKRTKMSNHDSAPVTNYLLWDETVRLLKQFRSDDPDRVLLSQNGEPLWAPRIEAGKLVEVDRVRHAVKRLFRRESLKTLVNKRSAKHLRKTGASLLKSSSEFHDLDGVYLSHAPAGMAERHYSQAPQARFDAAVKWLGEQLGFKTTER